MKTTSEISKLQQNIEDLTAQIDELISQVGSLVAQNENLTKRVEDLTAQNEELNQLVAKQATLIKYYEEQLLLAQRRRFGASSEKTNIGDGCQQMSLLDEASGETSKPEAEPLPEPELEEITYKRKKQKGKRNNDLEGLPVERIEYELEECERSCPSCGETMRDMGIGDVRRSLKLIPAKVVVVEEAVHSYVCDNCEKTDIRTPIKKAVMPKALISGSLASPSLVAHIIFQKYSNGMPLYRIENGFCYDGVMISRQTMSNWVVTCALTYLYAFWLRLAKELRKETVNHADETTLQVLHEPGRTAANKSYIWVYRTGRCAERQIAIYVYTETRKQEHPAEFLEEVKGYLHTDGYQVYHNLHSGIIIVGCWAHARRYWENALKLIAKNARSGSEPERGVYYINSLFKLERVFERLSPEERYQKRLEQSKPIMDTFFAWAENLAVTPKTKLGEAVGYSLSQREFLENVLLDGRLELSNNRAERAVKPFVQGRKAWLFSNTPDGAEASSIMFSIIETAKANGLHPYNYIKFLLEKLPNATSSDIDSFLPWSESLPEDCSAPVKGRK
jgi:transposase